MPLPQWVLDYEIESKLGNINGHRHLKKFGYNLDIDTTEDIWSVGGLYTGWPTEPEMLQISSASASDTDGGVGSHAAVVEIIDQNWDLRVIERPLSGVTNVPLARGWRVNRIGLNGAGSNDVNVGLVTVTGVTSGAIYAQVPVGFGQTQQAIFCVPRGHKFVVRDIEYRIVGTQTVTLSLIGRFGIDGDSRYQQTKGYYPGLSGNDHIDEWELFTGPCDVWLRATPGSVNTQASCIMRGAVVSDI